jgi:hypothetical protein
VFSRGKRGGEPGPVKPMNAYDLKMEKVFEDRSDMQGNKAVPGPGSY